MGRRVSDVIRGADPTGEPTSRIIFVLRERGSLSAAEIGRITGMPRSTVSKAVAKLRESGLVVISEVQSDRDERTIGRPSTVLELSPEGGTCIGLNLTRDSLRVAVADVSHRIIEEKIIDLGRDYSPELAVSAMQEWVAEAYQRNGLQRSALIGLGISVSAPVGPEGTVHRSSIVPTWAGKNVIDIFSRALDVPAFADNESNCSAIAEMTWGASRGEEEFILVKLDIGVGGGIVVGGKVLRGAAGAAGEFGHMSLDPAGMLCRCGNRGCLELTAGFALALDQLSHLHRQPVSMAEATRLAMMGDAPTLRMVIDTAEQAGKGLAMICAMLNPPLVLLSGRLSALGPMFIDPLVASFERHAFLRPGHVPEAQRTRIVSGMLLGNDVVLGAIGLVLRHFRLRLA